MNSDKKPTPSTTTDFDEGPKDAPGDPVPEDVKEDLKYELRLKQSKQDD